MPQPRLQAGRELRRLRNSFETPSRPNGDPHPRCTETGTVAGPRARTGTALVPAVSRALALMERLAGAREPMSLARLASDLALPKSSVHGLCNTLVSFGYLRRQPDGTFLI